MVLIKNCSLSCLFLKPIAQRADLLKMDPKTKVEKAKKQKEAKEVISVVIIIENSTFCS